MQQNLARNTLNICDDMLDSVRKTNSEGQRQSGSMFSVSDLRKVGEAISGYFEPGCLRPDWPAELEVGLDLGEVDSPVVGS